MNRGQRRRVRERLLRWSSGKCPGCGKYFPPERLTVDHIIPVSKGGSNRFENLQLMCEPCNNKKGDRVIVK